MSVNSRAELGRLSRLFSPRILRELGQSGQSPTLANLLSETDIPATLGTDASLADAFESAFATLRKIGNRDDYVYRNAIVRKVAMGRHNLRTATILNEFRARRSKVDIAILNGTSTAYEIKSERDSLQRLSHQIADYRTVFASVYVVTAPTIANSVRKIVPEDVGILVLTRRFQLQIERTAIDLPERTDPCSILPSLRSTEATAVLSDFGITIPSVPNTQRRAVLERLFTELNPKDAHESIVRTLRLTRSHASTEDFIKQSPQPLSAALLSVDLSMNARTNLRYATQQPLSSVLAWS